MEEKKKTTQTSKKKNNSTRKPATKTTQTKKVAPKKTTSKKTTPKKTQPKKVAPKKTAPKKVTKKVEKVKPVEPVAKVETKEEKLEKTIIFDGKQNKNLKEVVEKLEEQNVVVEDKVIKRSKVRKILIIIVAIGMVLVAAASLAYISSQRRINRHSNERTGSNIHEKAKENKIVPVEDTEKEITDIKEKYEHIITINLAQFETKALNKDDMIVLVASSSCSSCIKYEPDIEEVFKELDKKIYRIDIKDMKEEEIKIFRSYYAFTVTPTIFVVKDGIVVADTAKTGRMSQEQLKEWLDKNN